VRFRSPHLPACVLVVGALATAGGAGRRAASAVTPDGPGRGFPATGPWLSFYGSVARAGPLERVARTFRIINIDADPALGNFRAAHIGELKAGGRNRVISYLNLGACESFRDYFQAAPRGFVSCRDNRAAHRGPYQGYPDEIWMDPGNPAYQSLILEYVAPRLAATGVDGFFLDNLEIVEHDRHTTNGPCDPRCRQGGLELVARLRRAFPRHLIVMQNATGEVTRSAGTSEGPFPGLLDGISHESVFAPAADDDALRELEAWKALALRPAGRPFFIGTQDYVGSCRPRATARRLYDQSRRHGFSPYVSDASSGQQQVCYWDL
jgi:cysteinyl-tRNA synthetase, unknown class